MEISVIVGKIYILQNLIVNHKTCGEMSKQPLPRRIIVLMITCVLCMFVLHVTDTWQYIMTDFDLL